MRGVRGAAGTDPQAASTQVGPGARSATRVLVGILVVALAVRLWQLGQDSFWIDEISVVVSSRAGWVFASVRDRLGPWDPPASFLLTAASLHLPFGLETAARLPMALFGVVEVAALYALTRSLTPQRRTALIAAGMLAVAPFAVRWSQEARYYTMSSALHLLSWWALVEAIRGRKRWWWFAIITAASLLTNSFAWLALAAQVVVVAADPAARRARPAFARAASVAVLLSLPWLVYEAAYWSFSGDRPLGFHEPGYFAVALDLDLLRRTVAHLLGNTSGMGWLAWILTLLALSAPFVCRGRDRRLAFASLGYLGALTVAIVVLARLTGTYFAIRRVEFFLPVLLQLAALTATRVPKRVTAVGVAAVLALSLPATASVYREEKIGWREAAHVIERSSPTTLVVLGPFPEAWYPLAQWYLAQLLPAPREVVAIDRLSGDLVGRPRPVLWLTTADPEHPAFATRALNDPDRVRPLAGDRSLPLEPPFLSPLYASRSRVASSAELDLQSRLLGGPGLVGSTDQAPRVGAA